MQAVGGTIKTGRSTRGHNQNEREHPRVQVTTWICQVVRGERNHDGAKDIYINKKSDLILHREGPLVQGNPKRLDEGADHDLRKRTDRTAGYRKCVVEETVSSAIMSRPESTGGISCDLANSVLNVVYSHVEQGLANLLERRVPEDTRDAGDDTVEDAMGGLWIRVVIVVSALLRHGHCSLEQLTKHGTHGRIHEDVAVVAGLFGFDTGLNTCVEGDDGLAYHVGSYGSKNRIVEGTRQVPASGRRRRRVCLVGQKLHEGVESAHERLIDCCLSIHGQPDSMSLSRSLLPGTVVRKEGGPYAYKVTLGSERRYGLCVIGVDSCSDE